MTREEIIVRAFALIHNDLRHPHYQRTVEVAQMAYKYVTGQLDGELRRNTMSESEAEYKQRAQLTNHISKSVLKLAYDPMRKVPRSKYKRVLTYDADPDGSKTAKVEGVLAGYWGDFGSVDEYTKTRLIEINKTDPNTWIVQEFEGPDVNALASPYPFEVPAYNAVDFYYENNRLQFLTVMRPKTAKDRNGTDVPGADYTIYTADQVVKIQQVDPKNYPVRVANEMFEVSALGEGENDPVLLYSKERVFMLTYAIPYNLGRVPASRVGYVRDIETGGHTYVTPHDCAYPYLKKALKINSEFDLSVTLSVFPYRVEYGPACEAPGCVGGFLHDGAACGSCHGTGVTSAKSAQTVTVLPLPNDKSQMIDLEKLIAFKGPQVELITWMEEYVERLSERVKTTMYNSDIFTRKEIAETATAKNLQLQNAYDSLFDFAEAYAGYWSFAVNMCARITDLQNGLIAKLIFPKDFGFKGLAEMLAELESAQRANAGPVVVRELMNNIVLFLNDGNPDALAEYEKLEMHNPFSASNEMDISGALASPLVPDRLKLRHQLMNHVTDRIYAEKPDFLKFDFAAREEMIETIVTELIAEAKANTAPTLNVQ